MSLEKVEYPSKVELGFPRNSNFIFPAGRGGGGGGGSSEVSSFNPTKREGWTSFSFAEGGGGVKGFGVVLTQELEVLAILNEGGGGGRFHPLKLGGGGGGEHEQFNRSWGRRNMFLTCNFPIL